MGISSASVKKYLRFRYSGTNPSAATVSIYTHDGSAYVIGATEKLIITSFELTLASGGAYRIYPNGGTTAQDVTAGTIPTTGGGLAQSGIQRLGLVGVGLLITAAAGGQVDLYGEAEIR